MTRLRDVGERALLCEVDQPAAAARWIREQGAQRGVRLADVVPAARTVLASVPDAQDRAQLLELLTELPERFDEAEAVAGDPVEIAVRFDGPDLSDVADRAGMSAEQVVRALCEAELVSAFCGFSPGYAYLSGVPAQLHGPRRSEPRVRVPAGSLALADEYAAIYPRESPGGWHLIGTTDEVLFDVHRDPPALLTAGTRVQLSEQR